MKILTFDGLKSFWKKCTSVFAKLNDVTQNITCRSIQFNHSSIYTIGGTYIDYNTINTSSIRGCSVPKANNKGMDSLAIGDLVQEDSYLGCSWNGKTSSAGINIGGANTNSGKLFISGRNVESLSGYNTELQSRGNLSLFVMGTPNEHGGATPNIKITAHHSIIKGSDISYPNKYIPGLYGLRMNEEETVLSTTTAKLYLSDRDFNKSYFVANKPFAINFITREIDGNTNGLENPTTNTTKNAFYIENGKTAIGCTIQEKRII